MRPWKQALIVTVVSLAASLALNRLLGDWWWVTFPAYYAFGYWWGRRLWEQVHGARPDRR